MVKEIGKEIENNAVQLLYINYTFVYLCTLKQSQNDKFN